MSTTLSLQNIEFAISGKKILKNICFDAKAGEIIGFIGPNGAGKTTTMRLINGVYTASSGAIKINGKEIDEKSRASLGYLPEGGPLWGDMTPKEFLEFMADVRGIKDAKTQIISAVEKVEIQGVFHQRIDTLSKGFKRRVALAGAILHDPEILILDEPTDGLDPNQKLRARQTIKAIAKDKIIIISTHILDEVTQICDRVILINDGAIIADETRDEFLKRGKNIDEIFNTLTIGAGA